jgi:hypothetical protein
MPAAGGEPSALGCVGYSAGGPLATFVGVLSGARDVALFGAAGMKAAAAEVRRFVECARRDGDPLPGVLLHRNDGDQVDDPLDVRRWLAGLDAQVAGARHGGHDFRHYAANGTVAAAFGFVLRRLGEPARMG